jgi:CheY-like chemotaxis protein
VRFLALSVSDAPEDVIAIIRAGARGYVTKTISGAELADAVRRIADGDAVFSPRLAGFVLDAFAGTRRPARAVDPELDQLTAREREVLRHIARGYLYKEIALRLASRRRPSRRTSRRCCASSSSPTATSSAAGRPSGGSWIDDPRRHRRGHPQPPAVRLRAVRDVHELRSRRGAGAGPGDDRRRGARRQRGQAGRPFVGRAGRLLDELLAAAGLSREDVFITNVLKARPPKNRDPRPPRSHTRCRGWRRSWRWSSRGC